MKKILIASAILICSIINEVTAQFSYPAFFQQVNRNNTNRFTTTLSNRWIVYSDTTNDTITVTPSAVNNYYTISHLTRTDSITANLVIVITNPNVYFGTIITFIVNNNGGKTFSFASAAPITSTNNATTANYIVQFWWTGVKWQRTYNITD